LESLVRVHVLETLSAGYRGRFFTGGGEKERDFLGGFDGEGEEESGREERESTGGTAEAEEDGRSCFRRQNENEQERGDGDAEASRRGSREIQKSVGSDDGDEEDDGTFSNVTFLGDRRGPSESDSTLRRREEENNHSIYARFRADIKYDQSDETKSNRRFDLSVEEKVGGHLRPFQREMERGGGTFGTRSERGGEEENGKRERAEE